MRRRRRAVRHNLLQTLAQHPAIMLFSRIFLAAALAAALLSGAFYYLYNLPYFKIARIQIKNSAPEVNRTLSPALNKFIGYNILQRNILLDIKSAVEQMRIPYIKKAVARRCLPDTIIVEIVRRKGVAQVEDGARFYIVDEEGFVFGAPKDKPYPSLTIIDRIDKEDTERLNKTIKFLSHLSSAATFRDKMVFEIDASSFDDIYFWIDDIQVRFGEWDDTLDKKLSILDTILTDLADKEPKPMYIDLRFDKPVIGPR